MSEGKKAMRGSIATLEAVSPAWGIVILNEEEIRRGLIRNQYDLDVIDRIIQQKVQQLNEFISTSKQRIDVWRFGQLRRRHQLAAGVTSPVRAA